MKNCITCHILAISALLPIVTGYFSLEQSAYAAAQTGLVQQIMNDEERIIQGVEHQLQAQEQKQIQTDLKLLQLDILKMEHFPTAITVSTHYYSTTRYGSQYRYAF